MTGCRAVMGRAVCIAALLLTACNVIAHQQRRLEARLGDANLKWREVDTGDWHLGYGLGGKPDGKHRPVLLVHGFGASGLWQWTEQATSLAQDRTVLMPDLPWFGESKSSRADCSIDAQASAVVALLDALKLGPVDVVGISYGGVVACELACTRPEQVGRLVMIDSPGREYAVARRPSTAPRAQ